MYTVVGNLWNNIEFLIISNNTKYYVLNNDCYNGEHYTNCWEVADKKGFEVIENAPEKSFAPIYKKIDDDNFEIIGYEEK